MRKNSIASSRLVAQTIAEDGEIDFKRAHQPLLFIAGELDRSQPPIIQKKNAQAYTDASSRTDYHVFPGRTHNLHLQDKWEEVADYVLEWLKENVDIQ